MKPDIWIQDVEFENMEQRKAVKDRVAGLLHPNITAYKPIGLLIESAYIQGLIDGADIAKNNNKPNPKGGE